VYGAGDVHLGASLVVWAIAEGRDVAQFVDADLT
jgi:NADPH-dependent glutamate synthase beta subunit-like oxidoreductase